jgi:futalosine hydrolase
MGKSKSKGLIIAATAIEIAPLLEAYREQKKYRLPDANILITGIGLTASTYSLSRFLRMHRPEWIIQGGVGGCFNLEVKLGSVFAIKEDTIADQSVVELGELKTLFDLKLLPENQFPYQKGWLKNKSSLLKNCKLKKVKGISVNEITTSKKKVGFYEKQFDPVIESMEGAALHYVCLMEKIPFLQIRSVSNYIAERNKKNWDMKKSIQHLNEELVSFLQHINQH